MASKALATIALLLSLNLLFLSMANAHTQPKCQKHTQILNVCGNVLKNFLNVRVGNPNISHTNSECCSLIEGLVDLEVDACLCTVVKADVLGLKVRASVKLSLLLDFCHIARSHHCH